MCVPGRQRALAALRLAPPPGIEFEDGQEVKMEQDLGRAGIAERSKAFKVAHTQTQCAHPPLPHLVVGEEGQGQEELHVHCL